MTTRNAVSILNVLTQKHLAWIYLMYYKPEKHWIDPIALEFCKHIFDIFVISVHLLGD